MKHSEGSFDSVRHTAIYWQAWLPEGTPRAVLLIVHGLGEHSGRYQNVVQHLVPLGYAVYALDHIGHGKSGGQREYVESLNDIIVPLETFHRLVQGWQPDIPLFLLGHSMGGLIVAYYLLEHQEGITGALISAPAVAITPDTTPLMITLGKLLSVLAPTAGVLPLDASLISRDSAVVQAYTSDPLVFHGKTPARLAAELHSAMQRVAAEAGRITLPVIILQGSADRIVNPQGAQQLFDRISSADKTLKVYPGLYHEIFNEPEREQVLADAEAWLEAHLAAAKQRSGSAD